MGLVPATPAELAAFAKVLRPGRRLVGALLMYECEPAGGSVRRRKAQVRSSMGAPEEGIVARGRLGTGRDSKTCGWGTRTSICASGTRPGCACNTWWR